MQKRTLVQICAIVTALVAGLLTANMQLTASASGKVYEMRTYTANAGKLEALHARFRDHTMKLFEKHGIESIGYWVPTDPEKSNNTLVYLIAHKNRDAASKSWKAFRADPDWIKAKSDSEVDGALVSNVESVFLAATDYSPIQ